MTSPIDRLSELLRLHGDDPTVAVIVTTEDGSPHTVIDVNYIRAHDGVHDAIEIEVAPE
jgi:hypothetical protein